jgi:hypothetical protein
VQARPIQQKQQLVLGRALSVAARVVREQWPAERVEA